MATRRVRGCDRGVFSSGLGRLSPRCLINFTCAMAVSLGGMLAAFPAQASAIVPGTIPGIFSITASGAATYTIPIKVPHGAGGLTPSVALVYNSQAGDGAAGWGWSISGLSAITRCNKTIEDDGSTEGVTLTNTDDYCLDGERLRLTGSNTYDTELRQFDQITATGGTNGPDHFDVQARDGTTYEYGNTADSKILATGTSTVRVWALDKVTDANGNYYTISYQNNDTTTGDYWPITISYAGNAGAGTSPDHTITFNWAQRAPVAVDASFLAGTLVSRIGLLTGITVNYNGSENFAYSLYYNNSDNSAAPPTDPGDNRYQLTQIQECAADGSCFNPTQITWQAGAAGWQSPVSTGVTITNSNYAEAAHLMDVNGDGIDDLVYPGSSYWMVMFGKAGGVFGSPTETQIPVGSTGTNYYQWTLASDANGDGRMDLMVPGSSTWTLYEATGSETANAIFTKINTALSATGVNSQSNLPIYEGNAAMADYLGRGLGDFLYADGTHVYLVPNNGPASNPQFGNPQTLGAYGGLSNDIIQRKGVFGDLPMDFDGSGRAGELGLNIKTTTTQCNPQDQPGCVPNSTTSYKWSGLLSTDSGYQSEGTLTCWADTMTPEPLDATGGGLTDLMFACASTNVLNIELSTGVGFLEVPTSIAYNSEDPLLADYYGDGREEAIVPDSAYGSGWGMIRIDYDPASQAFTPDISSASAPYPSTYVQGSLRVGSIEADGLADLVFAEDNGGTYSWYYALHNPPSSGAADTVTSIQDGLGNTYNLTYASLTSTPNYTEGSGAIYPLQDIKAPLWVVTSYTASDGIGGTFTKSFTYSNAEMDVTGHGFLGFGSRTITDSRDGVAATDSYDQTFPWVGDIINETLNQSNGSPISQTITTYQDQVDTPDGVNLYFPYLSTSKRTDYDINSGSALKTITTTNHAFDGYGDVTDLTVAIKDDNTGQIYSTETTTTFKDTASSTYCISAPETVTVTKTKPDGTSLSRETDSSANFDLDQCRPTQTVVSAANAQPVTTEYVSVRKSAS